MKIDNVISDVEIFGLERSIRKSKYPMSTDVSKCTSEITKRTHSLAKAPKGSGHDNFLKGIIVQFDLTLTVKAWIEAERYHWFDIVSSQSTMHRLPKFKIANQYINYVDAKIVQRMEELVAIYNQDPTSENKLILLYSNPAGFRLTAGMTTSYLQLKTIYSQREFHELPEWRADCEGSICSWIETLPHSEWITGKSEMHDTGCDG